MVTIEKKFDDDRKKFDDDRKKFDDDRKKIIIGKLDDGEKMTKI